jgi:type VI secretion system protein ImpL
MKQILIKTFKLFIVLTAVVLSILLAFGISILLGWPLWVGLFILVGILGVWLGVIFFKKLRLRRREQLFVNQVIEQDDHYLKQMSAKEKDQYQELQHRWKEAIAALKQSQLKKFGNLLYVLPCYMVIGEKGSGKTAAVKRAHPFSSVTDIIRTSGTYGTWSLDWWFFEQAIIIDTRLEYIIPVADNRDKGDWQSFLTYLSKSSKKGALNGLVVAVAADKFLESSIEQGRRIRDCIDELMQVLGSKFPVYVLITKCDLIRGMIPFCTYLPEKGHDQAMGFLNQEPFTDTDAFLDTAMAKFGERLRDLRNLLINEAGSEQAVDGSESMVDPGLLLFPEEFAKLEPGLNTFLKEAFQEKPNQETPIFRGLFLSIGEQRETAYARFTQLLHLKEERSVLPQGIKGFFLHDFFSKILPKEKALLASIYRPQRWSRFIRNIGLTAWLAFGIALCGLLSYSFVKNLWILRDVSSEFKTTPVFQGEIVNDLVIMHRYREAILKVSQKNRNWWIPRFGLNESRNVEQQLKARFCNRFNEVFQTNFDKQMSYRIGDFSAATPPEVLARYIPHLVRRINLSHSRLGGVNLEFLQAMPQPGFEALALAAGHENIIPEIAEIYEFLYLYYLLWQKDENRLNQELNTLQDWLKHALMLENANLNWLAFWVNNRTSVKAVRLEDFWGSDPSGLSETFVAAAFTLDGKRQIDALLQETENALVESLIVSNKRLQFEGWYQEEYIRAWENFAARFPSGAELLKDRAAWQQVAARMPTDQGPYFALLDKMADELRPYSPLNTSGMEYPTWVKLIYALEAAKAQAAGEEAAKKIGILAKVAKKSKTLLSKVDKKAGIYPGTEDLAARMAAGKALYDYQSALMQFVPAASSREVSYQMAGRAFKKNASPDNSAYYKAYDAYNRLKVTLISPGTKQDIFWPLLAGPVNYLGAFICRETACQLQGLWEDEVLVEIMGISNPMNLSQLLFGEEGYAVKFVEGPARPFIGRSLSKGYYAKKAQGLSIAFEPAFLTFLSKGARSSKPVKANYAVTFKGLPTSANPEARIQPHATRLVLQCADLSQSLANFNYPVRKTLNWSPQKCGDVLFQIEVGNLVLKRKYKGFDAFTKFLKDFSNGRRIFYPDDFPDQAAALKRLGIKHIAVQYQFSGSGPAIDALHAAAGRAISEIAACYDQ